MLYLRARITKLAKKLFGIIDSAEIWILLQRFRKPLPRVQNRVFY
jgi:hypothetical protein